MPVERFESSQGSPVQLLVPEATSRSFGALKGFVAILVALIAVLTVAVASAVADAGGSVPSQSVQDELAKFRALAPLDIQDVASTADLVPDLTLLVDRSGSLDGDQWWMAVREDLLGRADVTSVAVDFPSGDGVAFHLRMDELAMGRASVGATASDLVALIEGGAAGDDGPVTVMAGGRALSDEVVVDRFERSVVWLAVLALLLSGYVVWRFGVRPGAVVALAWVGSVLLAGRIAARVVAPFDGTLATGPLLGALAGFLFALVVALRVLKWYGLEAVEATDSVPDESRVPRDGADSIRLSLAEVASDVILVLGGLLAVVGVLWIAGGSSRSLVAVIVGATVGAAFTGAVVAPVLAALPVDRSRRSTFLPFEVPTGAHLMMLTVLGLAGLLVVLAAFAFRPPARDLIDYRALPAEDPARAVGDVLGAGPGDPTDAVVTVVEGSAEATDTWAEAVATLSGVAWVDTAEKRYTGAGSVDVDPVMSLASSEQVGFRSDELAVVVPSVPIRSADGARLLDDIVELADDRVEIGAASNSLNRGSMALVIASVVLLALAGAGAVGVQTENTGLALTSFGLHLLGGAATVGLYRLASAEATAVETIAALAMVAVAAGLFELEYLHDRARFGSLWSTSAGLVSSNLSQPGGVDHDGSVAPVEVVGNGHVDHDDSPTAGADTDSDSDRLDRISPVAASAGLLATLGLLVAALWVLLGRVAGGGPTLARFGFALAVALVIEVALGYLVLRPTLLGEQAPYHAVARPLRSTLHAGQRRQRSHPVSVDDPAWRRLVSDLLLAEFALQTDPATTRVEDVFLEGTPLFRQATEQHRSLASSDLKVSGRAPQIRRVETFREGPSIMVSVTVDHPERHLVDYDGTVYGVRRSQRRSTMLWLVGLETGAVRIAESIDLGSVPLDVEKTPDKTSFPEVASVSG